MNKIILAGNPNTGKTTLFNTLTKSNEKASNWHGVTVGEKSKKFAIKNQEFEVVDLPGLYSIYNRKAEEKIACDYLEKNKGELILNICDVNNLKRNLLLTLELINNGYNIIIVLNMNNETKDYDIAKISKLLKVKIIGIDARNKKSVKNELLKEIEPYLKNQKNAKNIKNNLKYNDIIENIDKFCKKENNNPYLLNDKIDKILLKKWMFLPVFILSLFTIFYITFGPIGSYVSSIFEVFFNKIFEIMRKIILCTNISYIIKLFIVDGLFVGVQSVLSFIPQILLLSIFINVLEDIGFMSRVAFMFDGGLKKIGLNGKSLFSVMMGYGCTTSAILTTRNIENVKLRKRTVFILPFMSCSAKLPIFLVISSLFFEKYKYLFVFGLYILGIIVSLIFSILYKKIISDKEQVFVLEMPKYRMINVKKIIKDSLSLLLEFLYKIGSVILFFSSIVWVLRNFSIGFKFLNGMYFEKSILFFISNNMVFLFSPLGLNNVGIVVALILGIVAKEMIVVGFAMINGVGAEISAIEASLLNSSSICSFNLTTSIVFLVFVLLYSPCLSAIATIKNELGIKSAIYVFVVQFLIAYVISFFVYRFLIDYRFIFAVLLFLVLDILLVLVLKLKSKYKCKGNCYACRKI